MGIGIYSGFSVWVLNRLWGKIIRERPILAAEYRFEGEPHDATAVLSISVTNRSPRDVRIVKIEAKEPHGLRFLGPARITTGRDANDIPVRSSARFAKSMSIGLTVLGCSNSAATSNSQRFETTITGLGKDAGPVRVALTLSTYGLRRRTEQCEIEAWPQGERRSTGS
jgi:hypothetical protein